MRKNIIVFGAGYVGLATALAFNQYGHQITVLDVNLDIVNKLNAGICPIADPTIVQALSLAKGIVFDTVENSAVYEYDYIVIAVGTPDFEGECDLTEVRSVIDIYHKPTTFIVKSSVPPTCCNRVLSIDYPQHTFVANPEFLREGTAFTDFIESDRVIIGNYSGAVAELYPHTCTTLVVSNTEAELIKYASNTYLAMRLAYVNEISRLGHTLNVDTTKVLTGVSLDKRIGDHYFRPSVGFGGYCLPKDVMAFNHVLSQVDSTTFPVISNITESNEVNKIYWAVKILEANCSSVLVVGISDKPTTSTLRYSPTLDVMRHLIAYGMQVSWYDPSIPEHIGLFCGSATRSYTSDGVEFGCILITDGNKIPVNMGSNQVSRVFDATNSLNRGKS